jgi:hypothetical protein
MLRAMHDTCMIGDCDIPFDDCEIHHVVAHNGRNTRIGNMGPLCTRHHHDIHDRGWTITLDTDRNLTIRLPDGTTWALEKYRPPGDLPGLFRGEDGKAAGDPPIDEIDVTTTRRHAAA